MSDRTQQSVTLTPDQLQSIIASAVATALGQSTPAPVATTTPAADAKPKATRKANRKARTAPKAVYEQVASNTASDTKPASKYGKAAGGVCASDTAKRRVAQLEAAVPNIGRLATISHTGKVSTGLTRDLVACDREGVGIWTYVQLPGGSRDAADQICRNVTGKALTDVTAALKACGYGWHKGKQVWRTRCNGTPALGGRGFTDRHAERVALGLDD